MKTKTKERIFTKLATKHGKINGNWTKKPSCGKTLGYLSEGEDRKPEK
jgi:hypothetical protein